jgi:hypothetical protein
MELRASLEPNVDIYILCSRPQETLRVFCYADKRIAEKLESAVHECLTDIRRHREPRGHEQPGLTNAAA